MTDIIRIFTDGAAKLVNGVYLGGWGAVLKFGEHRKEISGNELGATNNRMELMAIYQGIKALKKTDHRVVITSDSQYCINALVAWWPAWEANSWHTSTGNKVANEELIREIIAIREDRMRFVWVKGHSGHVENEIVDKLAVAARKELELRQPA